jgi:hypothetical protein
MTNPNAEVDYVAQMRRWANDKTDRGPSSVILNGCADYIVRLQRKLADTEADYLRRHNDAVDRMEEIERLRAALRQITEIIENRIRIFPDLFCFGQIEFAVEQALDDTSAVEPTEVPSREDEAFRLLNAATYYVPRDRELHADMLRWMNSLAKPLAEPEVPQAPITKILVSDTGLTTVVTCTLYAPGLLPGEHDVWCDPEAVAPYMREPKVPRDAELVAQARALLEPLAEHDPAIREWLGVAKDAGAVKLEATRGPCPLCGRTDNHTHSAGPLGMT